MPLNEGDETSESDQAAQAVEEAGKTDEVAADVATMQQLLEDMALTSAPSRPRGLP